MTLRMILAASAVVAAVAQAEDAVRLGTALLLGPTPQVVFSSQGPVRSGDPITLLLPDPAVPGALRLRPTVAGTAVDDSALADRGRVAFAVPELPDGPAIGFALPGSSPAIDAGDGAIRVDVTGDGQPETLSACLTTEAMQLRAVDQDGDEVWQDYVPLGYDVEPTCP
jgi:hypothetical protein